jgi:hypothetical protein
MVHLITPGVPRLGEANIEGDQATTNVWVGALKGDAALLIGIEAKVNEGANKTPALGCPHNERLVISPVDGICRLGLVFLLVLEKGCEITHRREPKGRGQEDPWRGR